jgi:hypothetical protein
MDLGRDQAEELEQLLEGGRAGRAAQDGGRRDGQLDGGVVRVGGEAGEEDDKAGPNCLQVGLLPAQELGCDEILGDGLGEGGLLQGVEGLDDCSRVAALD